MVCGVPVIAYYLPSYEDLRGVIMDAPLGDIKRLASLILAVLGDEEHLNDYRKRGMAFMIDKDWESVAKKAL